MNTLNRHVTFVAFSFGASKVSQSKKLHTLQKQKSQKLSRLIAPAYKSSVRVFVFLNIREILLTTTSFFVALRNRQFMVITPTVDSL